MCRQETHLELQLLGQETVAKGDIVAPPKNISALGGLYRSVVSLLVFCKRLWTKNRTDLVLC
jgi:hypothetical protein